MKNNKMQAAIIAGLGVLVFAVVFAGILLTRNAKKRRRRSTQNPPSPLWSGMRRGSLRLWRRW